jgi:DNA-binding NtrC family response regulator
VERIKRIHSALASRRSGEYVAAAELACRNIEFCKAIDSMVGDTAAMRQVRHDTWAAAFGESLAVTQGRAPLIHRTPVRIHGETGTGKELIAQALSKAEPGSWNAHSGRWSPAPFEAVNLASIPVDLVAGALFGYEAGAHSTAGKAKVGILKQCHKGAVFLDEIAELPLPTQVALLRCLQEGKVRPLGALHDIEAQPRIISATHQSLLRLVEEGKFRRDLYHRLSAAVISLPPLRQRLADIPLLVEHVLLAVEPAERTVLREKVWSWLARVPTNYSWPGNVRELGLAVHVLALGLEPTLEEGGADSKDALIPQQLVDGAWTLEQVKRWYAELVLKQSPSQTEAAERLGVDRGTLKKLVKSNGR